MMGLTHRATGLAAGSCVAAGLRSVVVPDASVPLAVIAGVAGCLLLTLLCGRAALWPDLDHSRSTATLEYGFLSGWVHEFVEACSIACWEMTATEADRHAGSFRNHRGLTHFAITALVFGVTCGVGTWLLTTRAPALWLGLTVGLVVSVAVRWCYVTFEGGRRRGRRTRAEALGLMVFVGTTAFVISQAPRSAIDLALVGPFLGAGVGVAVATGMLAHDVGDAATLAGDPFWWPLKIQGRRYYAWHIRREENLTRTTKDSPTEYWVRVGSRVAAGLGVLGWVPGVLTGLANLVLA